MSVFFFFLYKYVYMRAYLPESQGMPVTPPLLPGVGPSWEAASKHALDASHLSKHNKGVLNENSKSLAEVKVKSNKNS